MRALVTGAKGQLGRELELYLLENDFEVIVTTSKDLDITNEDLVKGLILDGKIDIVINAAAYTNVDGAESDKDRAYAVNAQGPLNLAKACTIVNIPLIHVSTDYVFSDTRYAPHKVQEIASPEGVYAKTKHEGERLILTTDCKAIIVRTSWVFGRFGKNFVKTMQRVGRNRNELNVVCDQKGSPTPARALAIALVLVAKRVLSDKYFNAYGIYHFAGAPYTTWDEFAREILTISFENNYIDHRVIVNSISSDEYPTVAKRPMDSRLDTSLFTQVFNIEMPQWQDFIKETLDAEKEEFEAQNAK